MKQFMTVVKECYFLFYVSMKEFSLIFVKQLQLIHLNEGAFLQFSWSFTKKKLFFLL